MRLLGRGNLIAVGLAFVLGLAGIGGLAHVADAAGNNPPAVAPATPIPPIKAKPVAPPPPVKPYSGNVGKPGDTPNIPSYDPPRRQVPFANCRASCASACYNQTPCTDLSVTECTAARQRCRLTCDSTC